MDKDGLLNLNEYLNYCKEIDFNKVKRYGAHQKFTTETKMKWYNAVNKLTP